MYEGHGNSLAAGKRKDLSEENQERYLEMYNLLFRWEGSLHTYPHFYTLPYWIKASARNYEDFIPVDEPE
ncbi:MAG: hypothetical protein J7L04_13510 [Bacteroidales bacterium]|nr:hypothetical protein [Bacteroidales bacterium]